MNIVILDGATTNPGDLSWDIFAQLGSLTVYDQTPPELVVPRAKDAQILLVNRIHLSAAVLDALPNLRYIGALATGTNTIDAAAANARGIPVCNVPNYCAGTVAQLTFALLLSLCNHVDAHSALVKQGRWNHSYALCQSTAPWVELSGKTLGLLGCGGIGKIVAAMGKALGMEILVCARSPKAYPTVTVQELFAKSHVVSLHCPLTPETTGLVNKDLLRLMRPEAFLINTARGAIIHEPDLAVALREGWLAGAGLDVMTQEPPPTDHPFFTLDNCLMTPHLAWSSPDARARLIAIVADNLRVWQAGGLQNAVNETRCKI